MSRGEDMNGHALMPAPPARDRLPNRRAADVYRITFNGQPYEIHIAPAGKPAQEVFIHGHKTGSDMDALGTDVAILISLDLQFGVPGSYIADRLSRLDPVKDEDGAIMTPPASLAGIVADLIAKRDRDLLLPLGAREPGEAPSC